ncbi:MAG: hypothetical protein V1850_01765 [Candidatus Bathyarchaeota archaeon]
MVLITTSGRPTQRIRTLCNDLQRVIPNAVRINRGKLGMEGVYKKAMQIGTDKLIIVERWKGEPGIIKLYISPFSPEAFSTLYLESVKTQDEIDRKRFLHRDLIVTLEKNASSEVKHLAGLFSEFLGIPSLDEPEHSKNTSLKASMHLSSFQGNGVKIAFRMLPMIREIGPILIVKHSADNYPEETILEKKT